jgi:hypothetical protein
MFLATYLFNGKEITVEGEAPLTLDECVEQITQGGVFRRAFEIDDNKCFEATDHVLEALFEKYFDGEQRVPLTSYLAPIHHARAERAQDNFNDEQIDLASYGSVNEQASRDYYASR